MDKLLLPQLRKRQPIRLALVSATVLFLMIVLMLGIASIQTHSASAANGPLKVEIIAGYNLVVDSNVESPSTAAPSVATVIGRFCNTGTVPLAGVMGYIGDYKGTPASSTPGLYPRRYVTDTTPVDFETQYPHLASGVSGDYYAFEHIGGRMGTADATRFVGTLAPDECKVQYWHFTYPRRGNPDNTGNAVWGLTHLTDDDLWLEFDIWGTADGSYNDYRTWRMTMRNEIAAMANKIEPNNGMWFNTASDIIKPGDIITSNGVRYELGVVNQGFDNDGDFIYDYNAWLQPVGDPNFDPSCFRLIRTSGVLTITRVENLPIMIMPFEDTLYFMNLTLQNNGITGDVYYTFVALDGPCSTALTPYQEVASGANNEKFNADYGGAMPPVGSSTPDVQIDKTGNLTVTPGTNITYQLDARNYGTASAGLPLYNMPVVLSDSIPVSTTYVAGSVVSNTSVTVLYSTDGGATWTTIEPVPASSVTNIQVWMNDPLAASSSLVVTFSVQVNASFPPSGTAPLIQNCADASFGSAPAFDTDCAETFVEGSNRIGDLVWEDLDLNGVYSPAIESGLPNITVTLYFDKNGNGTVDSGDTRLMTATTSITGYYMFTKLPNGSYVVVVDQYDSDLPLGYRPTTATTHASTLNNSDDLDADFGFGPSLDINKAMLNGIGYDNGLVYYDITVENDRPGGGEPVGGVCRYTAWAGAFDTANSGTGNKAFLNPGNLYSPPGPDGNYATASFEATEEKVAVTGFDLALPAGTTISKVEILIPMRVVPTIAGFMHVNVITDGVLTEQSIVIPADSLADGLYVVDVTDDAVWATTDFMGTRRGIGLETYKAANPPGDLLVDALGYRITTNQPCAALDPNDIMVTVPLTDTYNTSRLQFVSAAPPESSVNTATGVITWTNIGPIAPGQNANVRVTFLALDLSAATMVTNTACSTGTQFGDGGWANNKCDTTTGIITPSGLISGVVWSDLNSNGWADGATGVGYETTDLKIAGVTINLYQCVGYNPAQTNQTCANAGGSWMLVRTQTTDANGGFLFNGLPLEYYYVEAIRASIPGSPTQTGDPDDGKSGNQGLCDGGGGQDRPCDNLWKLPSMTLDVITALPANGAFTDVNFGYTASAALYGTVWQDYNGDGTHQSADTGLDNGAIGVTVTLYYNGSPISTTQTITNGYYSFSGLVSGTYTITVDTGTLPSGGAWTQTAQGQNWGSYCASCSGVLQATVYTGQVSGSWDFGYHQGGTLAIGDTLYYDWDGDGVQGANEEGIRNVTVTLYRDTNGNGAMDSGTDAVVVTATTSITGYYLFTGLPAGEYIVVVDEDDTDFPARVYQTGDPDETGTCTVCDGMGLPTLSSTDVLTQDLGYKPYGVGAIGDTVWKDMNGDGAQLGPLETGISNIAVWLEVDLNNDGTYSRVMTATTDSSGKYLFSDLPDGAYRVVVDSSDSDLPDGAFGSNYIPSTPTSVTTTISNGNTFLDADFGFMPLGAIGDTVYWDANGNGTQDGGEGGIPSVLVTLTNSTVITLANGTVYQPGTYTLTTATDGSGRYLFSGLVQGSYTILVGSTVNGAALTGDPDADGVPCPGGTGCDGLTNVTLRPGTVFLGADFGYQPRGVIGDFVWRDVNGDGIQDSGEPGIAGVVVTVTNGTQTYTTTTDLDGRYSFANLDDGNWTVTFPTPTNMTPTVSSASAYTQGVGSVGTSITVAISGGQVTAIGGNSCSNCSLYVDSGFQLNGALNLSGHVFFDVSGSTETNDYYQSASDTGYSNIVVFLYDSARQLIGATTTDASGAYTFTGLVANSVYTVAVDSTSPQLNGMTLSAVGGYELATYHTVSLASADVTDVDFGFYQQVDFGDLADSYHTTLASEGPGHISGSLRLGSLWDTELDGQDSADATGDGTDEDGVARNMSQYWTGGQTVNLTVTVDGNNGYLVGWFDWDRSGGFTGTNEVVIFGSVVSGTQSVSLLVPALQASPLSVRFRLYDETTFSFVSPTGLVINGEVEDYQWPFGPTAVTLSSLTAHVSPGLNLYLLLALVLAPVVILGSLKLALAWRRA